MNNNITKTNGVRLDVKGLTVRPVRSTKKIVTQMLDGSHSVQQIGGQAIRIQVSICVTDKSELDAICASCETISVYHYGATYTGVIDSEEITWEPLLKGDTMYKGSFSLVVTE